MHIANLALAVGRDYGRKLWNELRSPANNDIDGQWEQIKRVTHLSAGFARSPKSI